MTACASSDPNERRAEAAREAEERKPPFIGMTKEQALARYGEPKSRAVTDGGEAWTYYLNEGDVIGSAMIPFNFSPTKPNLATLVFGPNGKVQHFTWTNPPKHDD